MTIQPVPGVRYRLSSVRVDGLPNIDLDKHGPWWVTFNEEGTAYLEPALRFLPGPSPRTEDR
jgi:hypothetical protein